MFQAYSVKNLASPKTGKPVPNQFVITRQYNDGSDPIWQMFVSYETRIAVADCRTKTVRVVSRKYSRTTSKYTAVFLNQFKDYAVEYVEEGYFG